MKELYIVKSPYVFNGILPRHEKNVFAVVGVPLDSTSSFRNGCRFAPYYIRLASQTLELYSLRTSINVEEVPINDLGDVVIPHGDVVKALNIIENVISEMITDELKPVIIGGEHTLTIGSVRGVIKALGSDLCYLCFDAHADFRSDYLGVRYSHACVTRRIHELLGTQKILLVGTRAISHEELKDLKTSSIKYITAHHIRSLGFREVSRSIAKFLEGCGRIYLSIDLDVVDPAYAPGVTTPEPEGITPTELLDILQSVLDKRIIGFDVVEVTPSYDSSMITSILAAKIINEVIAMIYRSLEPKQLLP